MEETFNKYVSLEQERVQPVLREAPEIRIDLIEGIDMQVDPNTSGLQMSDR